ncbi:MAG TPA: hypothetical protein VHC19_23495 [Pirellulales bacterium]|nr:hypothetical protein [Pirellulales bacterium]
MLKFLPTIALAASAWLFSVAVARCADKAEPPPQPRPISGSREMLQLYGVDESYLRKFINGAPLGPDEEESLWRTLFAVRRFALVDIDRWTRNDVDVKQLAADPDKYRGELIELSGRVKKVEIETPLEEVVDRFNLAKFYRCELAVGEEQSPATVYALAVPKAWKIGKPLDERCAVKGLFVKLAGEDAAAADPVLVAQRVAWYPETVLGDLKMDIGLYDEISPRAELGARDRECFYQLLAAAGRAGTQELLRRTPGQYSAVPLFNEPEKQRGKLIALEGTARQCLMRRVEDPDIVARFGIDQYYEIEMDTVDSQNNPIVFCVRDLPPGFPQGERIFETVRIPGFYFKKWGYRVQAPPGAADDAEQEGLVRRQLAPLLVGRQPRWIKPEPFNSGKASTTFIGLFVVGTFVLWLIVWRLGRSDDRFHKRVVRKAIAEPEPPSLNDLGLEDAGPPRFD